MGRLPISDNPSSILLLRLQATGGNVNLWGGYLNTALSTLERAAKGYQAYSATGSATISWANYSASNDFAVAFAKINSSGLAGAYTLTLPSQQAYFGAWNNTSYAGTLKNTGGTGIAIPANRRALLYGDGTDIGEAAPNWLSGYVVTLTNNGDIVVYATLSTYVASAIAAASLTNTGQVLNSLADTTSGYHLAKHDIAFTGLLTGSWDTENAGANELARLNLDDRRTRRRALFVGQV